MNHHLAISATASSTTCAKASRERYSVLRSSPAFVLMSVAIACAVNYADPDLWIHVLAGQRMLATSHIVLRDFYSYAAPDLPWHNHEWLTEIVFSSAYR